MRLGVHAFLQATNEVLGLGVRELAGFEERAGHVRAASALGMFFGVLFSAFNMAIPGMERLGQAELALVVGLLTPAMLASRSPRWVGWGEVLVVLASMGISFVLIVFGGIEGTGLFWVGMVPFLGFFIGGQRHGWFYCLAMIAALVLYFSVVQTHLPWAHQHSSVVATQFVLSFVFYTLVAAAFNRARSAFEDKLQQRVEEKTADAKALLSQLEYLATHDSRTGLPNQVLLLRRLEEAIVQTQLAGGGVVVSVMRLERLFELTQVLGPEGADQLIHQVAAHLRARYGTDTILARTRRDEFAVFAPLQNPTGDPGDIAHLVVDHPIAIQIQGYSLFLEFTTGLACFPDHAPNAERLLHKAEQAMLQAGKSARSWSLYSEDQEAVFVQHHLLFGRLRDALQHGHLQLYFQPQFALGTGALRGAEALVRWWDPTTKSMIPPVRFIPIAEESGLIRPLTRWVIEESLRCCAQWQAAGLHLSVSINLSALNLLDPDLLPVLQLALQHTGLHPGLVHLEITESCFMDSPERAMEVVRHLHQHGFKLSIDDFGTGYSSLSYLKNLPVSELKIDQGFVRGLLDNPGDQAIVASTIELAHNLRMSVVAEGIEDGATAQWLLARHCELGQGYHFAKPMPADQFLAFAQAHGATPSAA